MTSLVGFMVEVLGLEPVGQEYMHLYFYAHLTCSAHKIFLLVKVKGTLQTGHFLDIDHFKNVSFSSALFFPALYFFHPSNW
jgi:hypothetical protein